MRFRLMGVAIVASGLLLSACSSGTSSAGVASIKSPGSSVGGSQGGTGNYAAFDACMRKHGADPNPPASSGGGVVTLPPSFGRAFGACESLQPPAPANPTANADFQKAMLKQAACMRAHGIPVPDPSFGANGAAAGSTLPAGVDPNSPAYHAAEKKCQPAGFGGGVMSSTAKTNGSGTP